MEEKRRINDNRDGYSSACVWKIRNLNFCIDRIGNVPECCSDFHGNHFRYRERHVGGAGAGSEQQSGLPAAHAAIGFPDHVLEEKTGDREQFLAVQKLLTVGRFSRKRENEMLFDVAGVKLRLVRVNHGSVGRRP